ncbi:MAG TPA: hypothetical protein VEC06_02280 [Paucimonas sp.]|nr:hypothetical protein [Paucimonas sp.]
MTVTYGGKGCSRSEATKAAFAKDLKQAVVAMDAATDARARAELRTSTQQKLYDIADLRHQSRHLSGPRYYGQK